MKNFYVTPLVEVVEIEIEDAVLNLSDLSQGNSFGDWDNTPSAAPSAVKRITE